MLHTLSRPALSPVAHLEPKSPFTSAVKPAGTKALALLRDAEEAIAAHSPAAREYVSRLLALLDTPREVFESAPKPAGCGPAVSGGGLAAWQRRRITGYIDDHIDSRLGIATLAELVNLSPSHFCKVFKRAFAICPHAYVMRRRVERAQAAMLSNTESLSQIALAHGFSDQAHFCRVFRKVMGQSPRHWRRAHQVEVKEAAA